MDPFLFIQFFYWLSLSTWFGGVLFVTIAAPIIFRTIRESDPTLPTVLSVNLEGQHATLLAGSIVANLLSMLVRIELACAAAVGVAIVAQGFLVEHVGAPLVSSVLRTALFLAAVAISIYDWRVLSPRIWRDPRGDIQKAANPPGAHP